MSWRHTEAAGLLDIKRPPVKAVLLTLAHHASNYDCVCWPDLDRIMLFTGLSRRAVQDAIRALEQLELVTVVTGRNRRASVYTVTIPGVEVIEQSKHGRPSHGAPPAVHGAGGAVHGAGPAPQLVENKKGIIDETRARPLDDDWAPSERDIAWARGMFPKVDHASETRLFIAKAQAKGETYVNPTAAWRAWLERADTFRQRDDRRGARPNAGGVPAGEGLRERAARRRAQDH